MASARWVGTSLEPHHQERDRQSVLAAQDIFCTAPQNTSISLKSTQIQPHPVSPTNSYSLVMYSHRLRCQRLNSGNAFIATLGSVAFGFVSNLLETLVQSRASAYTIIPFQQIFGIINRTVSNKRILHLVYSAPFVHALTNPAVTTSLLFVFPVCQPVHRLPVL